MPLPRRFLESLESTKINIITGPRTFAQPQDSVLEHDSFLLSENSSRPQILRRAETVFKLYLPLQLFSHVVATKTLASLYPPTLPKDDYQPYVNHAEEWAWFGVQGLDFGIRHLGTRRHIIMESSFSRSLTGGYLSFINNSNPQSASIPMSTQRDYCGESVVSANVALASPLGKVCFTMVLSLMGLHTTSRFWVTGLIEASLWWNREACFTYTLPSLVNARVAPHLNNDDSLSAMMSTENSTNCGNLVNPVVGIQRALRPSDGMFLCACPIEYWITAYHSQSYFLHAIPGNSSKSRNAY